MRVYDSWVLGPLGSESSPQAAGLPGTAEDRCSTAEGRPPITDPAQVLQERAIRG